MNKKSFVCIHTLPKPVLLAISFTFFFLLIFYFIYASQAKSSPTRMVEIKSQPFALKPTFTPIPTLTPSPQPVKIIGKAHAADIQVAKSLQAPAGFCVTVPILMYHHIEPLAQGKKEGHAQLTVDSGIFETQMSYLKTRGYNTITLEQLTQSLVSRSPLPGKSIVLTFDDGYSDAYNFVYPILKKYNFSGGFMLPTGLLNNPGYMNWDQIKEMSSNGLISFYNHTWSHVALGNSTKKKIDFELDTSSQQMRDHLGKMNSVFAYPYGSFSSLAIGELQSRGFTAAVTTLPGWQQCAGNLMRLRRNHVGNAPLSLYGL